METIVNNGKKRIGILADFETRSRCDIDNGSSVYSNDPSTEVLCLCVVDVYHDSTSNVFTIDRSSKRLWKFTDGTKKLTNEFWVKENEILFAHNALFEYNIAKNTLKLPIKITQLYCTAVLAQYNGYPRSLSDISKALPLQSPKDDTGKRLMVSMCKPDKNGEFIFTDEKFARLCEYCLQDIEAESELLEKMRPMGDYELSCYHETAMINDSGLPVDMELINSASAMVDKVVESIAKRFPDVNLRSHTQIKAFAERFNYEIASTDKEHINLYLEDPNLPPELRELLEAKDLGIGSSSVSKFDSIKLHTDSDGILRNSYMHHGAIRTGRWSATGVQIHNLPRGEKYITDKGKDGNWLLPQVRDAIRNKDYDALHMITNGKIMDAMKSVIRAVFAPKTGKVFIQRDLAAIEARGVLWVAGAFGLKIFRDFDAGLGEEPYMIFAKKLNTDRFVGKLVCLSCIAEGTLVLTNRGWIEIESVTPSDKVFDGDNFVACGGAIYKGEKPVSCSYGLPFTEDHKILVGENTWEETRNLNHQSIRSAVELASLKLLTSLEESKEVSKAFYAGAHVGINQLQIFGTSSEGGQQDAIVALRLKHIERNLNTMIYSLIQNSEECGLLELAQSMRDATIEKMIATTDMEAEVYQLVLKTVENFCHTSKHWETMIDKNSNSTESTTTKDIKKEILDSQLDQFKLETEKLIKKYSIKESGSSLKNLEIDMLQCMHMMVQYIERLLTAVHHNRSLTSNPDAKTTGFNIKEINIDLRDFGVCSQEDSVAQAQSCQDLKKVSQQMKSSGTVKKTYDIKDAGKNSRFIVSTNHGFLIVHNCGYGIGVKAFARLFEKYGRPISEDFARECIETYKAMFPEVKEFWYKVDNAAKKAIAYPGVVTEVSTPTNPVKFKMHNGNLLLKLPSERVLTYVGAELREGDYGKEITYMTHGSEDGKAMGWHRTRTWGGAITGHIVQGFSACIMRGILLNMRKEFIPSVMTTHDEAVTISTIDKAQEVYNKLGTIMKTAPVWAKGLPIESKGWIQEFFIKD